MLRLLLVGIPLVGCTAHESDSGPPVVVDTDSDSVATETDAPDTDTDTTVPTSWSWSPVPIVSGHLAGIANPSDAARAAGNDTLYFLDASGLTVGYVDPTYVQPTGRWCVNGAGGVGDCEGTTITAGRITTPHVGHLCVDDLHDWLYLVGDEGALGRVATTSAGTDWNRMNTLTPPLRADPTVDPMSGPCAASGEILWLSRSDRIIRATALPTAWRFEAEATLATPPRTVVQFGTAVAVLGIDGSLAVLDATDLSARSNPVPDGGVTAIAATPGGALWVAHGTALALVDDTGAATADVEVGERILDLTADPFTGAAYALENGQLDLVDATGVLARTALDYPATALVPAGQVTDAVLVGPDGAGGADLHVLTPVPDDPRADPRAPLTAFLVTTLENPFDDLDIACTAAEDPDVNFESEIDRLRANIPPLQQMGFPVVFGVTWQFATTARRCGFDGVLQELDDAGFELGYMVHDRPCHSCTDGTVAGETPDVCNVGDLDYMAPDDAAACWPSNPEYCAPGDQDCWLAFVSAQALDVDGWLPEPAKFIFGADRHRIWGWDPFAGYMHIPRADGSVGYRYTMFADQWVYPDIPTDTDPRGKDPAPRDPEWLSRTWYVDNTDNFYREANHGESPVVYMPGNGITVGRLYEWQSSGLTMVELFDERLTCPTTEQDTDVLTALLRQAASHRRPQDHGTWYFHLSDLTAYSLHPTSGGLAETDTVLEAWKAEVDEKYGPRGQRLFEWRLPSELRAELPR
jgi:hypothetical protein